MKMFFYSLIVSLTLLFFANDSAWAEGQGCGRACELYQQAQPRSLRYFRGELVCINFTLPHAGAKVTLQVFASGQAKIEDSKWIPTREGRFCYPRSRWLKMGLTPEKISLCSEHRVTLRNYDEMLPVFSSSKRNNTAYACLRGVAGCGGVNNVSISRNMLDQ